MGGSESGGGVDGVVTKSSGLHPKLALAVSSGVTQDGLFVAFFSNED